MIIFGGGANILSRDSKKATRVSKESLIAMQMFWKLRFESTYTLCNPSKTPNKLCEESS